MDNKGKMATWSLPAHRSAIESEKMNRYQVRAFATRQRRDRHTEEGNESGKEDDDEDKDKGNTQTQGSKQASN